MMMTTQTAMLNPSSTPNQALAIRVWPLLLLLAVAAPLLFIRLDVYPAPWYDEGYSMQVARSLLDHGVYGTYNSSEGFRPFDPTVSSGPTIILPMYFTYQVFGLGVTQSRIIVAIYALLGLLSLYAVGVHLYGRAAGLMVTLVVLAAPAIAGVNYIMLGRQMLGEAPSLALILLGLWLWLRSWNSPHLGTELAAGLMIGLGIVSKNQVLFPLVPALGVIALGRTFQERRRWLRWFLPLVFAGLVVLAWMLVQRYGTTEAIREESSALLLEALQLHFFTGLFGSNLSNRALLLTGVMLLGAAVGVWRIWRASGWPRSHQQWAEASLVMFVTCSALWFALLSIGFERYAYFGYVLAGVLLGKTLYDGLEWARQRFAPGFAQAQAATIAVLTLLALGINGLPLLAHLNTPNDAQAAADYVDSRVPPDAVIESLEIELASISQHAEYHRAHYSYMYTAIRQRAHQGRAFDLNYDVLNANPDYLITGTMSNWLGLYDPEAVASHFESVAQFGTYHIYKRIDP